MEGKVEAVSEKTKGIKVNSKWYNPFDDKAGEQAKNDLKGRSVKINLQDGSQDKYTDVTIIEDLSDNSDKTERITKIASLKIAAELLKAQSSIDRSPQDLVNDAIEMSKTISQYVNG